VTRVKICGITNLDDAMFAVGNGADAIGFVFVASSPRHVSDEQARDIREKLPPFVSVVGVFIEPDPHLARETFERVGLDFIQFYKGDEERLLRESGLSPNRLIRAVRVGSEADLDAIGETSAGMILLDTKVEGWAGGGTGKTFDWSIAAKAASYGKPIILSGGLNPENIEKAIEIASPRAVDVCSGVESAPGKKDPEKVRQFIRRAKGHVT
jgi:phosphoribosylanthranilate isomerase